MYKDSPIIGKGSKVAESAILRGKVLIGENCGIWHNAVIRTEGNLISIGNCSNVQDNCVLHVDPNTSIEIGDYVTIGHGAIIHGCKIGNNVIVGMNAVIMNNAVIGDNCIIGAGALVPEGKVIEEGSVVVGNPYRFARKVSQEDIEHIKKNALHYVDFAKEYL